MSWDVILMNVPSNVRSISELEDELPILGSKIEVLSILSSALPSINLSDPTWGVMDGDNFSIEFSIGDKDPIQTIMLFVRGSDDAVRVIEKVCQYSGWRALDTSLGDFISFEENPAAGLQQWRAYRNQVFASLGESGEVSEKGVRLTISRAKQKWWQFWR
ncbi:MAG: hypothetical protein R3A44_01035 [Caldilineaceae bacterium]